MRDVVESFVIGLAERVDGLQDGEMAGDFGAISRAAGELAAAAREAGYPSIVDAAERVATASAARAGEISSTTRRPISPSFAMSPLRAPKAP